MSRRKPASPEGKGEKKRAAEEIGEETRELERIQSWIRNTSAALDNTHADFRLGPEDSIASLVANTLVRKKLVAENPGELANAITEAMAFLESTRRIDRRAILRLNTPTEAEEAAARLVRAASSKVRHIISALAEDQRSVMRYSDVLEQRYLDTLREGVTADVLAALERRSGAPNDLGRALAAATEERALHEQTLKDAVTKLEAAELAARAARSPERRADERIVALSRDVDQRLIEFREACVAELLYVSKTKADLSRLPDGAVDEADIERKCADKRFRDTRVCKKAAEWRSDTTCTPEDKTNPTSSISGDEIPPDQRVRLRFKLFAGAAHSHDMRTFTRCFDVGGLKYLIAVARAQGRTAADPESKMALSSAQLRRIDSLPWPDSAPELPQDVWDDFRSVLESKTRTLETVQRRAELATRLMWLRAGSPNFPKPAVPFRASDFAYSDDAFWYKVATAGHAGGPEPTPPPISSTTRRQSTYHNDENEDEDVDVDEDEDVYEDE